MHRKAVGLETYPKGFLPTAILSLLSIVIMLPNVGALALVP